MATFGSFPGVRVQTVSGGITGVRIGAEEKLLLFGEAEYDDTASPSDDEVDNLSNSAPAESPEQINARREANDKFGDGSELAEAMKEALANGANIDFLYGVAVNRINAVGETQSAQDGTLDHPPVFEDTSLITVTDDGSAVDVEFRYGDGSGNPDPPTPTTADTVFINPLTGQYAADAAPDVDYIFDYKYLDYASAFSASDVINTVNEDETGIFCSLSESDLVASSLQGQVSTLRNDYQLVNALAPAEPNDNSSETPPDARYDTANYANANQSITEEYFYKLAPVREEDEVKTVMGGVGGLFAGNAINDPIYNEALNGYQSLEQQFTKSDADNIRNEDIIPIRDSGTLRVKGNRSTAFSESGATGADFWRRRITDRVILIGKLIGDRIIGRINDEATRNQAEREIRVQMESLVGDRLIRANTGNEINWTVDVYEDSTNPDEVNIDIAFTPYGIVKRVDETITINTN